MDSESHTKFSGYTRAFGASTGRRPIVRSHALRAPFPTRFPPACMLRIEQESSLGGRKQSGRWRTGLGRVDCLFEEGVKGRGLPAGIPVAAPLRESEFALRKLDFEADEVQRAVLDSRAKRGILCWSRQLGKSTVVAAKAVHRAWTAPGATILVASPSERQSGEFVRKAAAFLQLLGVKRRGDGDNATSLALPNGSRIVGLPGTEGTVRGFSAVSMLLIDEAARVPDAVYHSLRPMRAVGNGDLWLLSTPYGKRGFFYMKRGRMAGPSGSWHMARGTGCPRIAAAFLEEERRTMG